MTRASRVRAIDESTKKDESDERRATIEDALYRARTARVSPRSPSTLSTRLSGALRGALAEKIPVALMMLIVVCVTVAFRGDEEKTRSMIAALTQTPLLQIGGVASHSFTRNSTTNATT
jgi:hypothetical protein